MKAKIIIPFAIVILTGGFYIVYQQQQHAVMLEQERAARIEMEKKAEEERKKAEQERIAMERKAEEERKKAEEERRMEANKKIEVVRDDTYSYQSGWLEGKGYIVKYVLKNESRSGKTAKVVLKYDYNGRVWSKVLHESISLSGGDSYGGEHKLGPHGGSNFRVEIESQW